MSAWVRTSLDLKFVFSRASVLQYPGSCLIDVLTSYRKLAGFPGGLAGPRGELVWLLFVSRDPNTGPSRGIVVFLNFFACGFFESLTALGPSWEPARPSWHFLDICGASGSGSAATAFEGRDGRGGPCGRRPSDGWTWGRWCRSLWGSY